jgi:putative intracellular protease/amidase
MTTNRKALIVVTSHAKLGDTGRATGFYYDEMATPYWTLTDAGYEVEIASPQGGTAPFDAGSYGKEGERKPSVQRFIDDAVAMAKIHNTHKIGSVKIGDYAAIFMAGGHGTMWDFNHPDLAKQIGLAWDHGLVVGAVCHGPAALVHAVKANGRPVVEGLRVNSFTDAEEAAVGLTEIVPYLVETELKKLGAHFEGADNFKSHAVRDGRLVTGQNPASVQAVAALLIQALEQPIAKAA